MQWLALILILAIAHEGAGEGLRLRFTRVADMPESGLSMLLPAAAKPDPLPPPAIMEGRREGGGKIERLELQNPLEVWRWKQREGRWIDDQGNRLILAAPTLAASAFVNAWQPKDDVAKLMQPLPGSAKSWSAPELTRWLETFWGVAILTSEPVQRGRPFTLADLLVFTANLPDAKGLAVAFRLSAAPDRWRVVLLEVARGTDPAAAEKALRNDFLPSLQPLTRRTTPAASPRPGTGKGPASALDESRERARESIRNMKNWWTVEGPNTIILSDIRSGKSQLVDAILEDLEKLRPAWEALLPAWEPARDVAVVRVFGSEEDYVRYVGPDKAWTSGLWMGDRRELLIRPMEEGSVVRKRRAALSIVYHEGFHQYLDSAFGGLQPAPWFNEGYATLFGSIDISGRRVSFVKDPAAVATLAQLVRQNRANPARILALDYGAFYGKDDDTRRAHYALAWGLMYFLQGESDARKTNPWRAIPSRYAAAFRETRDPNLATLKAFEGVAMDEFTTAFIRYWK